MTPQFDTPGLARLLEGLTAPELDAVSFAAIRVDAAGRVRAFNSEARSLLGGGVGEAIGRSFYGDIAPSLATAELRGRIDKALERGAIDLEFGHSGAPSDPLRGRRGRMQPATGGGFWLFLAAS